MPSCLSQTKEIYHAFFFFQFYHQFLHYLCPQQPLHSLQVCEYTFPSTEQPGFAPVSQITSPSGHFTCQLSCKIALAFLFLLKSIHIVKYYINYTSGCVELLMWLEPRLCCFIMIKSDHAVLSCTLKKSGVSEKCEIIFNKKYFLRNLTMFYINFQVH